MCVQCTELDRKIEHFQKLVSRVLDPPTIEGITKLIGKIQDQKATLHPDQKK